MKNIFVIILFVFSGCTSSVKVIFPQEQYVRVEFVSETLVSIPLEMEKKDGFIFISDFRGDSLLHRYDIESGMFSSFLPYGEGPNEFLPPVQFFFFDDEQTAIYNRWHYTLRHCMSSSIGRMDSVVKTVRVSTDIDMIAPLAEGYWVASGRFDDCRFIIMDEGGDIISHCGDYPSFMQEEERIPNFPKFMFHQSMFGFHEELSRLVSVTGHVFELWDYSKEERKLDLYKRFQLSDYSYKYKEGEQWAAAKADRNIDKGGERIYCTDSYIYILYNTNTHEMIEKKKDSATSEIWTFDWEGNPVMKICMDKKIICFCVDEIESKIYCVMNAPDPSIGCFKFIRQ